MTLKQIEKRPKKAPKQSITTKKDETKTRIKFAKFTNIKELKVFSLILFQYFPYFLLHLSHCSLYDEKTSKNILKSLLDEEKKIFFIKQKLK